MDSNDYLSVNHILAEASQALADKDFRSGMSKGWYISRIQDALQEIAIDTFYQKITDDFDVPADLNLPMIDNAFNIRLMVLYNGDCCTPSSSATVHWKRNYNNKKKVDGAATRNMPTEKANRHDPILPSTRGVSNYYYAAVENGVISLSPGCSAFSKIRITYNGMGIQVGDTPVIPRFFERAVNSYVQYQFWLAKSAVEPRKWIGLLDRADAKYNQELEKAKIRISSMNSFEKESMDEYISNALHK